MAKDSDMLQAVRDRDVAALTKLLAKSGRHKSKHGSATKKLNVNYQDHEGMSALHQASLQGDEVCMTLLLDAGAVTDVKDNRGMRPLHYAAWQGLLESVRMLLACGAAVDESAEDGETPLHLACQHGHLDVVHLLLQHGADPAARNKSKRSPLDLACEFGKCKVVEHLIRSHLCDQILLRPGNCDFADGSETTCLHLASKNGHANIVQLLLSSGVDINWQTAQGTALHEAALCGKTNVVRLLIQHGVDVNISNSFDQTALDVVDKFTTRAGAKELKTLLHEASSSLLARAVKDYGSAYDKSILPLKAGDLITILERRSDGFWKGFLTEAGSSSGAGYFPSDCVVVLATGPRASSAEAGDGRSADSTDGRSASGLSFTGSLGHQHTGGRLFEQPGSASGEDDDCPAVYHPLWTSQSSGTRPLFPGEPAVISPGGGGPFAAAPQIPAAGPAGLLPHQQPGQPPAAGYLPQRSASLAVGGAAAARETRGSSSRTVVGGCGGSSSTGRPPSLQSGQSFDGCESVASGGHGGAGTASRRSVRSDDGGGGGGGGPTSGADTCSSISAGSSERLVAAERRGCIGGLGEEYGCEDDWESGYASCSFNAGQLLQLGTRDAEVLRAWLAELHFDGYSYVENFLQAGYDMQTVSRMTPEDLTAIGITVPAHRRKLTGEIARLHIGDGLPDFKPATVMEWLQLLRLEQYHDALVADGYSSVATLTDITWEDLEEIGINKLGHQKKIMLAIEQLKKVGKRHSCSSQSSCGSEVPPQAGSGSGLSASNPKQPQQQLQQQSSIRRSAEPVAVPSSHSRVHHRSVSGDMVHSLDGSGYGGSQRSTCRQLSCDSAMTRSLMLQQTMHQPSAGAAAIATPVSRSNSGHAVSTCPAGPVGGGDSSQQQQQRSMSLLRTEQPDDNVSVNSSEDSASSSAGSYSSHHMPQWRRLPVHGTDALSHPAAAAVGRATDKSRHTSGSGSGGGGSSPPQYSTLARQASSGSGGGFARSHRTSASAAEESPYAELLLLPSREATPPLGGALGSHLNPHSSPFAEFKSPYAAIQNGYMRGGGGTAGPAASPPRHGLEGFAPSQQQQPSSQNLRHRLPTSHDPPALLAATAAERCKVSPAAVAERSLMTEEAGGDEDADSASSTSECELDGHDFPPVAPPIAFDMQHMRVHRQPRAMPQLPALAERRLAAAAAASAAASTAPQVMLGGRSSVAKDGSGGGEARITPVGGGGSESSGIPTTPRRGHAGSGGGSSRGPSAPDGGAAEAYAGTLPFANENAGTIRQRPASTSSSTCSGSDAGGGGSSSRQGDDWDGLAAADGATTSASGLQRRMIRAPLELASYDGPADDVRRFARPVMHVQPVVVIDQHRYSSAALPALSALQRLIFEEDDPKEKEAMMMGGGHSHGISAECAAGTTDLDAILEHDADAS